MIDKQQIVVDLLNERLPQTKVGIIVKGVDSIDADMLNLIEIRHPNVAVSGFHPGGGFNKPIHHKRGHNKSA